VQDAVDTLVRGGAIARDFALPEAEAAYGVFLKGGLSAIELRSFLDRELPEWLDQLDPVIAPAVRSAETLSALDYLGCLSECWHPDCDGEKARRPLRAQGRTRDPHVLAPGAPSFRVGWLRWEHVEWKTARLRCIAPRAQSTGFHSLAPGAPGGAGEEGALVTL
jgi:hypothetical protein